LIEKSCLFKSESFNLGVKMLPLSARGRTKAGLNIIDEQENLKELDKEGSSSEEKISLQVCI